MADIAPGIRVRDLHNPSRVGFVTNKPPRDRPSGSQWQIAWDGGNFSWEYAGSLETIDSAATADEYDLVRKGRYGRANDLRRNLTFVHLTGRLANLVYSMGITNTDFYPHQYRPLLTLLDSPGRGIVIADEVGLGKTIEAGLIWTEFRARYDKRRLLVVCPAMLREKWRDELEQRFGVAAQIVGAQELLNALSARSGAIPKESAWIISYQGARPPKAWKSGESGVADKRSPTVQLAEFLESRSDEADLIDMVIFDEAHYMRNRETGAWHLANLLRNVSEFQVMLSATPINLRNEDLFSLLTLVDPDHFTRLDDLDRLIASNRPLVEARDAALNLRADASEVLQALKLTLDDPLLAQSEQLKAILREPPTNELLKDKRYRTDLADALERINLLSQVLIRTRKRDVLTLRVTRDVQRVAVELSLPEREFYDAVTSAIREYALKRDISDGFLLAMPQRQVSSCPAALLRSWLSGRITDEDVESSANYDLDAVDQVDWGRGRLRDFLKAVIPPQVSLDALERNDTKLRRLTEVLTDVFKRDPTDKVIVFTAFRATASYLQQRLSECGMPAELVWGQQDRPKHEVIEGFRQDPRLRVLVSTEVAAEGVDLQFCKILVNYDLPWNPTRVEQRIGRIDRLGQKSHKVFIWNLFFKDTIDDRIISRLLERLRVFEEALGETEAIIGETISHLEYELLCRPRTAAEEQEIIDKAALVLEGVRKRRLELEANAPHMMAHGQRILERIAAAQQLSRFVTENDLFVFVRDYLERYWSGHEFVAEQSNAMAVTLRLPPKLAAEFDLFIKEREAVSQTRLATGSARRVLFRNNVTQRFQGDVEVIHQFHPLVSYIAGDLRKREEQFYPLVAIHLAQSSAPEKLPAGDYVFYVMQWSFSGVQQDEWLATCAVGLHMSDPVDEDAADMLVQAARIEGVDWVGAANLLDSSAVQIAMERAEEFIEKRYQQAIERKKAENADRARFQLDSIDRYESRRLGTLDSVEEQHRLRGRDSLVRATRGQRKALVEKMAVRRATVREREHIHPSRHRVCAGVVRIE